MLAKCPICKVNDADKKNVHLIPWFLIKDCVTQRGTGARDMELSFSINPREFTKMFVGRGVLPESIEEFAKLDKLEKEEENPYSRDNLICNKCEENLSRLETIFATQFSKNKIANASLLKPEADGQLIIYESKYNVQLFELFIQSIFYRCSIGRFNGLQLHPNIEKSISNNLNDAFNVADFKKITPTTKIDVTYSFPLIVSAFSSPPEKDTTQQFIVTNHSRFPYFIMAGRWQFQLFELEKHLKNQQEWLYGISGAINSLKAFNTVSKNSHVIFIDQSKTESISRNLLAYFTDKKIIGIKRNIRDLHFHIFKKIPDAFISRYIFERYFFHFNEGKTEFDSVVNAFLDLKLL